MLCFEPVHGCSHAEHAHEGAFGVLVAGCDGAPLLQSRPAALDEVAVALDPGWQATGASLRFVGMAGREPRSQMSLRNACEEYPRSATIHSAKAVRKLSRTGAIGSSLAGPGARAKPIARPAPSAMTQALVEKPPRERPSASRWSRCAEAPPFWPHQRPFDGPGWWCRRGTPSPA